MILLCVGAKETDRCLDILEKCRRRMAFLYVPVGDGSDHKAIIGKSGQLRDFIIGIREMPGASLDEDNQRIPFLTCLGHLRHEQIQRDILAGLGRIDNFGAEDGKSFQAGVACDVKHK